MPCLCGATRTSYSRYSQDLGAAKARPLAVVAFETTDAAGRAAPAEVHHAAGVATARFGGAGEARAVGDARTVGPHGRGALTVARAAVLPALHQSVARQSGEVARVVALGMSEERRIALFELRAVARVVRVRVRAAFEEGRGALGGVADT